MSPALPGPQTHAPYPVRFRMIQIAPLWHGVELLRGLCLGGGGVALIGHVAYLVALTAAGIWIAARRLEKRLLV